MANPLVPQGIFNKLRASIKFNDYPSLNVSASFLTQDAVDISFQGDAGVLLPTMTGGASSPNPYQMVMINIHLVRSQAMAQLFKNQIERDTFLGDCKVYSDSTTLGDFSLRQTTIRSAGDVSFSGRDPAFLVSVFGIYDTNSICIDYTWRKNERCTLMLLRTQRNVYTIDRFVVFRTSVEVTRLSI